MNRFVFITWMCFFAGAGHVAQAQSDRFLFGRVSAEDFSVRETPLDENANVLILMNYGEVYLNNNSELVYVVQTRMRILNENGLIEANQGYGFNPKYSRSRRQFVDAHTLNIDDNGRIKKTRVGRNGIFIENVNEDHTSVRIAFPDVKVGSIIEFIYSINIDGYFRFPTWDIQRDYPILHSEFITFIPNNLVYMMVSNGFATMEKQEQFPYRHASRMGIYLPDEGGTMTHFISKNVPALYEEPFITTMSDYRAALQFQLNATNHYYSSNREVLSNWKDLTTELLKNKFFGERIRTSPEVVQELASIGLADTASALDKAKAIYSHVAMSFNRTGHFDYFPDVSTSDLLKTRSGNNAAIAFGLLNMLQQAGLDAHPVLLSQRQHGRVVWEYPLVSQFNHMVVQLSIGSQTWLLDPVSEEVPFGLLSFPSLNKEGYLVKEPGIIRIPLNPRQKSREDVAANIVLRLDGSAAIDFEIRSSSHAGMVERETLSSTTFEAYSDFVLRHIPQIEDISRELVNVDNPNEPLIHKGTLVSKNMLDPTGELFLMRPSILLRWDDNPLVSPTRTYPVNFGVEIEQNILIKIDIPSEFTIESLPDTKQTRVGQDAYFQSSFVAQGNMVHATYRYRIQKSEMSRGDYSALRALISDMVDIHSQAIVLRRTDS